MIEKEGPKKWRKVFAILGPLLDFPSSDNPPFSRDCYRRIPADDLHKEKGEVKKGNGDWNNRADTLWRVAPRTRSGFWAPVGSPRGSKIALFGPKINIKSINNRSGRGFQKKQGKIDRKIFEKLDDFWRVETMKKWTPCRREHDLLVFHVSEKNRKNTKKYVHQKSSKIDEKWDLGRPWVDFVSSGSISEGVEKLMVFWSPAGRPKIDKNLPLGVQRSPCRLRAVREGRTFGSRVPGAAAKYQRISFCWDGGCRHHRLQSHVDWSIFHFEGVFLQKLIKMEGFEAREYQNDVQLDVLNILVYSLCRSFGKIEKTFLLRRRRSTT